MAVSDVEDLSLDEKTLIAELENIETQIEKYIRKKLELVNEALDEILPLEVHRKLLAIALRIFKIVLRTYTTIFIRAPILLLKLVLKFIFSRVFQLDVKNLLDEFFKEIGSDDIPSTSEGVKGKSTPHKMGTSGAKPRGATLLNLPMDGLLNENFSASRRAKANDKSIPATTLANLQGNRPPPDRQETESDNREGVNDESTNDKGEISGTKLQDTNLPSATSANVLPVNNPLPANELPGATLSSRKSSDPNGVSDE
ncbi:hypothetical protein HS088_TW13G01078 [Tripterygium wilfordii]|uniref:Uncharacterized protein n=1 Tax=Tripterygium wilfordii TaxID=458696 RepID=A0A7J7CVT9_TRIWF|nr:hypothetical protein HS088_TW13G01078 [Tripterygium wilfordii]